MSAEPPTFLEQLEYAVLSEAERIKLAILWHFDPIAAGVKLGAIRLGQRRGDADRRR